MFIKNIFCPFIVLIWLAVFFSFPQAGESSSYKVLVVMSYEEHYPWCPKVKEGIESVLKNTAEIRYFYMDTKKNLEGGEQKAKEAYALYLKFHPDGVITVDDNAQWMFVIPYLKDKVKTPVMFCGVNASPEKYGYPASNVSGILERYHIAESIALAKLLVPSIHTFGFISKDSPTAKLLLRQIRSESDTYPAKFITARMPRTLDETVSMSEELRAQCDLLLLGALEGLPDKGGKPTTEKKSIPIVAKTFGKPIIAGAAWHVTYGTLCAVLVRGEEQGSTAAEMLLKAMQGTPVSDMPITRNRYGKRIINVTVMKALGIKPRPIVLRGAELVRTED